MKSIISSEWQNFCKTLQYIFQFLFLNKKIYLVHIRSKSVEKILKKIQKYLLLYTLVKVFCSKVIYFADGKSFMVVLLFEIHRIYGHGK